MRELRIVQIANRVSASDGGPARNCFELNLALNRAPGVTASLVTIHDPGSESIVEDYVTEGGELPPVPPRFVGSGRRFGSISFLDLLTLIRHSEAIIVHGIFLPWVPMVLFIGWTLRKPLAIMPHGALTRHELNNRPLRKRAFLAVMYPLLRRGRVTIATGSEPERSEIERSFSRVSVAWVGVGTNLATKPVPARPVSKDLTVLTMSRLAPKKRIDLVIEAISLIRQNGRSVRLVVAGGGEEEFELQLREHARRCEIEDFVNFIGVVRGPEKRKQFDQSDIFVLPSEDENFGIGVAEAAVCGLPVVASSAVAAAHLIPRGSILFDRLTSRVVADAIERVMDDTDLRAQRSENSRLAQRVFGWQPVAERWLSVLDGMRS